MFILYVFFLECLYLLTLKNKDFDKENHDDVQCTELYTRCSIKRYYTRKNIHKPQHEMERWTVLNSEEMMGRHRDFLQSSEIEIAKDNSYTHRNRRGGRVA